LLVTVIGAIRREKAEKQKPLNAVIKRLRIYAGNSKHASVLSENKEDIIGTCKIAHLEILSERGKGKNVEEFPEITFISEY